MYTYTFSRNRIQKSTTNKKKTRNVRSHEFLGLYKLFDHSYNTCSKLIWLIAILACISGCVYQVVVRVRIFTNGAILYEVEIMQQIHFKFPTVSICDLQVIAALLEISQQNDNTVINITKLWIESGIKVEDVLIHNWEFSAVRRMKPASEIMKSERFTSSIGSCLMLFSENKMWYRGQHTYLDFIFNINTFAISRFVFFVHDDVFKHRYDSLLMSESVMTDYHSTFRITAKQFINLNTSRNPCMSASEAYICINNCMDNILSTELSCRHPILNSANLKTCTNRADLINILSKSLLISYNISQFIDLCKCKRKCNETVYSLHQDDQILINKTLLRLIYANDKHERIIEREVFTMSALLTDIGGALGLYLGLSIFAVIDFIEYLIRKFVLTY